jgi:hypothetical protein
LALLGFAWFRLDLLGCIRQKTIRCVQ